jgi:hypothetical protein
MRFSYHLAHLSRIHSISWLVLAALLWMPDSVHAELEFAQTTIKLGKTKSGVPLTRAFPFVVNGRNPIEVVELRPGCGCVTTESPKKVFQAGEKGSLSVRVNTLGEAEGVHHWYVYVVYRQDGQIQQTALQIVADIEAEIRVQPARLNIHAAGTFLQEIRLTDTRPQPLKVLKVQATAPYMKVVLGNQSRDQHGHWITPIDVQIDEPPAGRNEARIDIYTADAEYGHLQVPVVVTRPPPQRYSALPQEVHIAGPAGGTFPSRLVVISDARDEPVTIDSIKTDNPAIKCRWARGPGNFATMKIQVDPDQFASRQLDSTITVEIAGTPREIVTIPVHCTTE